MNVYIPHWLLNNPTKRNNNNRNFSFFWKTQWNLFSGAQGFFVNVHKQGRLQTFVWLLLSTSWKWCEVDGHSHFEEHSTWQNIYECCKSEKPIILVCFQKMETFNVIFVKTNPKFTTLKSNVDFIESLSKLKLHCMKMCCLHNSAKKKTFPNSEND